MTAPSEMAKRRVAMFDSYEYPCDWDTLEYDLGRIVDALNEHVKPEGRSHIVRDWNGGDPPYLIG